MFGSPGYLGLLVPWVGVVVWVMRGTFQRTEVPFLELWGRPAAGARVKRALRRPPMGVVLVCVAMLVGILAASGPVMPGARSSGAVTVVVDRGITMSANDGGESRRDRLIDEVGSMIAGNSSVRLVFVPGSSEVSSGSEWAATAKAAANCAVDTRELLGVAIADALRSSNEPVVVLSDQRLDRHDARVIQVSPQSVPRNVCMVRLAASELPKPQVMVGLRNQSAISEVNVTVESGEQRVMRAVQLKPGDDAEEDFFFDLSKLGDTVEASVDAEDDVAIDNRAYLVRQRTWPKLEAHTEISDELRRMIQVYQQRRGASEESVKVGIWRNQESVARTQPSIQIVDDSAKLQMIGNAKIVVVSHPITTNVDWSEVGGDGFATPQAAGGGWLPVVRAGSLVLVAVREKPVRQVRVSFNSERFNQSANFVIFWANVFDWVGGGGGEEFVGEPVRALGPEWGLETAAPAGDFEIPPGIYRRSDGERRALNVMDVKFQTPPATEDWRGEMARSAKRQAAGGGLQKGLALGALGMMLLAILLWPSMRRMGSGSATSFSGSV